ncbi:MAG: hypothetical protein H6626_06095 [Pseudobdellovibrionaceae bacterium]|nr:hypothetical protein [Bdellovibrionales bacterium]USN48661.1 MAG: hypothetical protein H6626_06095 [Pseudobdellovibrionaceae bacterium]
MFKNVYVFFGLLFILPATAYSKEKIQTLKTCQSDDTTSVALQVVERNGKKQGRIVLKPNKHWNAINYVNCEGRLVDDNTYLYQCAGAGEIKDIKLIDYGKKAILVIFDEYTEDRKLMVCTVGD